LLIVHLFATTSGVTFLTIRDEVSAGNALVLISLFILLFHNKYHLDLEMSKFSRYTGLVLNFLVFFLFGSRTYLIIFILFLFFLYFDKLSFKQVAIAIGFLLLSTIVLVVFIGTSQESELGGTSFIGKLMVSFTEISVKDYSTVAEMGNNLRGFEAFMAFKGFQQSSFLHQFFGNGFGALIDLETFVPYGITERRFIPIIHNGYMFILIKLGILGIICYVGWFIGIYRKTTKLLKEKSEDPLLQFFSKTCKASILALFLTNLVVTGMFNSETQFLQMFIFVTYSNIFNSTK